MNITVSSSFVNYNNSEINNKKKILLLGAGISVNKIRDIINPKSLNEVLSYYGDSDLYRAYELLINLNVPTNCIYTANCFYESDYIRIFDKIIHYDFDYLIPIGIYLSDKFYNPISDENEYYYSYFLEQLASVESLTTILSTERHASLYEDFDHYVLEMMNAEWSFMDYFNSDKQNIIKKYGNNLNFVYNNLEDIPYANIVLGALYCNRNYSDYFGRLSNLSVVYNIDSIDIQGLKAMYFKYNYYTNDVTLENPFNFKNTEDIYTNALIDDVIKRTIKSVDLNDYKGRLYNPYVAMKIEGELNKKLKSLKNNLFKNYTIEKIEFKLTEPNAGYILIKFSIIPFGSIEKLNIVMGVV